MALPLLAGLAGVAGRAALKKIAKSMAKKKVPQSKALTKKKADRKAGKDITTNKTLKRIQEADKQITPLAPDAHLKVLKKIDKVTKAKTPKNTGGRTAAGVAIPSSITSGNSKDKKKPKGNKVVKPTPDVPSRVSMAYGGKVKKTGAGRGDGCAVRGKTRGRII
tara:strand:+ start:1182 stop:1673 length:492 start_codon:yes stop_codon:yes gene_type:complete